MVNPNTEAAEAINDIMKKLSHLVFHDKIRAMAVTIIDDCGQINVMHISPPELNFALPTAIMFLQNSVFNGLITKATDTMPMPTLEMPMKS